MNESMEAVHREITGLLNQAVAFHKKGNLEKAGDLYTIILEKNGEQSDAMHLKGVICHQKGQHREAVDWIRQAILHAPHQAGYYNNMGNALKDLGKLSQAVSCYEKALRLKPGCHDASINLSKLYASNRKHAKAIECLTAINTDSFEDGNTCLQAVELARNLGSPNLVATFLRRALTLQPANTEACIQLGSLLVSQGSDDEAIQSYERFILQNDHAPEVHNNLGVLFRSKGQADLAIQHYRSAVTQKPNFVDAIYNLGNALGENDSVDEAIFYYQRALEIDPMYKSIYHNLARLYQQKGLLDKAIAYYERSMDLNPDLVESCSHLCYLLKQICDWNRGKRYENILDSLTLRTINGQLDSTLSPFLNLSIHDDPSYNLKVAQTCSNRISDGLHKQPYEHTVTKRLKAPCIRIGYISQNIRNHPTAHLLHDIFHLHDREKFEVYCYSLGENDGSVYRRKIEADCDVFRDMNGIDSNTIAKVIHRDKIDLYIDLMGQTSGSQMEIAALRPAPIQVRYLGMAGTTGSPFFDYLISDPIVTPPDQAPFYSEKFAYMPFSYQVNSHKDVEFRNDVTRENFGLPLDSFVFCSFNSSYKIDRVLFEVWMRVLKKVPQSVLWIMGGIESLEENLKMEAKTAGVDTDRIVFAGSLPKEMHLKRLALADLVLDTRIVNGAASTSDALWMKVPVLTLRGTHFASRMSASILAAADLPELVTHTLGEYEDLAVSLATNDFFFKQIQTRLENKCPRSVLFDTAASVKFLETAYLKMWQKFCRGEKADTIWVQPDANERVQSE